MMLNPTKPTMAIANPSSMPVRNMSNTTARPMIPMVTSFIFPSEDLDDIADQHQTLDEATDPHPISNRIERHLQGKRDLPRLLEINAIFNKIPADQEEQNDHKTSRSNIENISYLLRKSQNEEIHKDMSPQPGGKGDGKSYDNGS
jgi:hypothetical protein